MAGDGFEHLDEEWLRGKAGVKWASTPPHEIPAWVADMDFPPPQVVVKAMLAELRSGDLGYPDRRSGSRVAGAFVSWMGDRHGATFDAGRVREFNDVLNAVQAIFSIGLEPGDGVAFHTPTYPPFLDTFEQMGLRPEPIPLVPAGGSWTFDAGQAAQAIERSAALLIVNPHNPTGRVLTRSELESLLAPAREAGCIVVSDEVHADLVHHGGRHVPTASLDPMVTTVFSATKSFNLAGIRCAVAHVGSARVWDELRRRPEHLFGAVANLSVTATVAAWSHGVSWLEDLRGVLADNRARLGAGLPPDVSMVPPEGTYLGWLDFRATALAERPAEQLRQFGVRLYEGTAFGEDGAGFARLNFATSPGMLSEVLDRLRTGVDVLTSQG
jgi:cysteine-S-conjugate beta-lyase